MEVNGKTLVGDESLIYFHNHDKIQGIVSLHVDDFQGAGTEWFFANVMDKLANKFKISRREEKQFKYTGVNVRQIYGDGIFIDQDDFKDSLKKVDIPLGEVNDDELDRDQFAA